MIHHRQYTIFTYFFLLLSTLAFLSACHQDKGKEEKLAYSLFIEATNYNAGGEKEKAIHLIDSALQMDCADTTRSWLTSEKMTAYTDLGKMREAIAIGKEGIPFAEKIKDDDGMLAMCGAMGICYRRIGELDSSLTYYKKGIHKAIQSENAEYEIYLYNCISVLFNEQKRYKEAIEYSDKAESKAIATNDTIERLSAHANKAAIFMRQGEFQKCVNTLTPIWSMVKQANYNVLMLKYLSPLLKSYLQLGKTDSIALYLPYADEASRSLAATSNGVLGILEIKADLLGQQKKYAEQWALLDSIAKLSSTNQTMPKDKLLATKAKCLHNMGKSAQAYQTMHEAYLQSDSLKQSDIDKQRAELSEKTSYINGVENERKRLAKELHDGVCNDILAVNIMMQTNREEAERLLKNVGHNVRHLSHELIPPRFDNTSLPELVEIYCQSVTAEDGTIVKPFISTSFKKLTIHSDKALEIYRIIQECVSNAIKYGYSKMISVVLDTIGTQGVISVTNDLSPVHPITQSKSGIGKDTLKLRTDALQAELQVRNTDEEYQVEIKYQL